LIEFTPDKYFDLLISTYDIHSSGKKDTGTFEEQPARTKSRSLLKYRWSRMKELTWRWMLIPW